MVGRRLSYLSSRIRVDILISGSAFNMHGIRQPWVYLAKFSVAPSTFGRVPFIFILEKSISIYSVHWYLGASAGVSAPIVYE